MYEREYAFKLFFRISVVLVGHYTQSHENFPALSCSTAWFAALAVNAI